MEINGFTGGLYRISSLITIFTGSNLLWILFNFPIVYLILCIIFAQNVSQIITLGITILLITPIVFFPATTALYGVIRKWVYGEEIKIFQFYLRFYKENYIRSAVGGSLICLMWIVLFADYYYFTTFFANWFIYLFIVVAIFSFIFTLHFFSLTVHIHVKLKDTFKFAILLTFGKPLLTLVLGAIIVLIMYLSFYMLTFLIPFFLGSLITYLSFYGFHKFYMKIHSFKITDQKISHTSIS
ncbi:YesL family protein [Gracilibacillus timonensis]|uniref:YesL family protein n=1 Tax=Gracilibacillus timonensis TaxID=1816696 RepID=UPI000824BA7B|nr:DUF624 domain-containing protein [Gracilibacillus timonensis]